MPYYNREEALDKVRDAMNEFPPTFYLAGHDGLFRIQPQAHFQRIDTWDPLKFELEIQILLNGKWLDYCNDTPEEIKKYVRKAKP